MARRLNHHYQPMQFTSREITPSLKRTDKQSGWRLIAIDEDRVGKCICLVCRQPIALGSVRIRAFKRDEKKAHLDCWKLDPIAEPNFFPGFDELSEEKKKIVQEYCDRINSSVLQKRKAEEALPETRAVKRICLETLQNEKMWEAEGSKCPIKSLPIEIMHILFDQLDLHSLQNFSRTCKRILVLATDDEIWQKRVEAMWSDFLHLKTDESQRWFKFYQIMLHNTCYHCRQPTPLAFPPLRGRLCIKCRDLKQYYLMNASWVMEKYQVDYNDLRRAGIVGVKSNTTEKLLLSQVRALSKKLNRTMSPHRFFPYDLPYKPGDEEYEDFKPDQNQNQDNNDDELKLLHNTDLDYLYQQQQVNLYNGLPLYLIHDE